MTRDAGTASDVEVTWTITVFSPDEAVVQTVDVSDTLNGTLLRTTRLEQVAMRSSERTSPRFWGRF